jgi:SAM-dependent methyltransferase
MTALQREIWSRGDFHQLGVEQIIVGERLCEQVALSAGMRVLDVACGAGNTTLAAARRRAIVTGCDFVPALLERAARRARAERLRVEWVGADAHELPFPSESFEVVLSTFGVMFASDPRRAADELLRVCRPGGTIAMANWTPASAVGDIFRLTAQFVPPPAGARPAVEWGSGARLRELFGDRVSSLRLRDRVWRTRLGSFDEWLALYRTWYGPINQAFAALDPAQAAAYAAGLQQIVQRHNRATDGTILAAYEYVEVIADKAL